MKLIKIVGYLMVIAALEGALQEYRQVTSGHGHHDHGNTVSHEGRPVLRSFNEVGRIGYAWYEIIMVIMQSVWALVIGALRWIWGTIRTWIELLLIVFECSELVHKLGDRFNLWGGLSQIKIG
jgi:hypothetical protein